jgi:hypothetical protein
LKAVAEIPQQPMGASWEKRARRSLPRVGAQEGFFQMHNGIDPGCLVEEMLNGRQPAQMMLALLVQKFPARWPEQVVGFPLLSK